MILLSLRFIHQVQEISLLKLKGWWKLFLSEIKIWFLILLPIYIYLFFRLFFFHYRSYPGQFYNLFNPSYYAILASALFNQLGFFFIFGLLGFLFIFKKEKHLFGPLLLLLLGMTFFFMCDHAMYIGYSRWNLFLFPFFIFSSTKLISSLKKTYQVAAIILILTSNFFLCPIHLDGSRLPSWGLPLTDGSGCIYPYEKAIRYLKEEQNTKHLVVFGQYHSYAGFNFYFNKYDFHPQMEVFLYPEKLNKREEELSFQNFFRDYNNTADTILYHSINNINLDENLFYGRTFKIVQSTRNLEHSIYILKRTIP
jgi:hypothetical protein